MIRFACLLAPALASSSLLLELWLARFRWVQPILLVPMGAVMTPMIGWSPLNYMLLLLEHRVFLILEGSGGYLVFLNCEVSYPRGSSVGLGICSFESFIGKFLRLGVLAVVLSCLCCGSAGIAVVKAAEFMVLIYLPTSKFLIFLMRVFGEILFAT